MQFQVPQFIDVAPKIVGPLTIRQFLYIAAAALPSFLLFFILQFWLWIMVAAILVSAALALAFAKVNGQPLPRVALAAFHYLWRPRFYLWRRVEEPPETPSLPRFPFLQQPERAPIKDLLFKIATTTRPIEKREVSGKFFASFRRRDAFEEVRKTTGERGTARRVDYR